MEITSMVPVLDAANIAEVSAFWAGVLGGRVSADEDWHTVLVDDVPRLDVQLAPDHTAPTGQPASRSRSTSTSRSPTSRPRTST